jgi:hypothetical protein
MVSMSENSVDLEIYGGQCTLVLRSDTQTLRIKNHWVNDRVWDLTTCIEQLSDGVEAASCRWPGPANEGYFVDFVVAPDEQVSIAVSVFGWPGATNYHEIWGAERGDLAFIHRLPLAEFVMSFTASLRRLRATGVDRSGLFKQYPRPFPQLSFDRLERRAVRWGYAPTRLEEIEDPSLAD